MKSGNLNFLEPSGALQACNGTAYCSSVILCDPRRCRIWDLWWTELLWGRDFLWVPTFFRHCHSSTRISFMYHRRCSILTVDSVVNQNTSLHVEEEYSLKSLSTSRYLCSSFSTRTRLRRISAQLCVT